MQPSYRTDFYGALFLQSLAQLSSFLRTALKWLQTLLQPQAPTTWNPAKWFDNCRGYLPYQQSLLTE